MELEIAKVIPAWFGAISAWLLRCPDELHAHSPIDIETNLRQTIKMYDF